MQYEILNLELTSLYLQQHYFWCSSSYLSYIQHHCTYKSTSSNAVTVTYLIDDITVTIKALALLQYQLLTLELTSLYLQQQ